MTSGVANDPTLFLRARAALVSYAASASGQSLPERVAPGITLRRLLRLQ